MRWRDGLSWLRAHLVQALLAVLAVALLGWAATRWTLGPEVVAVPVLQRDFVQTVVASGRVEAPHRVDIGAQVTGTVRAVPVAEGQTVAAGQVLIELEAAELQAALQQAELAVQQAQVRLRQLHEVQLPVAEQALRQAQVNLDNARSQLKRQQDLFDQGFIGQAALDDARRTVELADAAQRSAAKQLDTARPSGSDVALAEAALAQARAAAEAARARLAYLRISAPAAGTLISRDVEPGQVVQPGKALLVLSPAGETQLVVQVDEKNLGLLALGQRAQVSADAYPDQRFTAELVYINPGIDAQRGSVEVKLRVPAPPAYLKQDMTVSVDIQVARRPQALVLPLEAVHEPDAMAPWVLLVDGRRARRAPVTLGLKSGGYAELLQGLRPGAVVVPPAAADVHDGSAIRPRSAAAP